MNLNYAVFRFQECSHLMFSPPDLWCLEDILLLEGAQSGIVAQWPNSPNPVHLGEALETLRKWFCCCRRWTFPSWIIRNRDERLVVCGILLNIRVPKQYTAFWQDILRLMRLLQSDSKQLPGNLTAREKSSNGFPDVSISSRTLAIWIWSPSRKGEPHVVLGIKQEGPAVNNKSVVNAFD